MKHGSNAGRGKRVLLSLLATLCLAVGSPVAVASAAGGAQKPVDATHGDCKNDNAGNHYGYVCPSDTNNDGSGGDTTGTVPSGGGDPVPVPVY